MCSGSNAPLDADTSESHASFASYTLVHAVSLPLAFNLNYGADVPSSALFSFTASLSLCLASFNLAQPLGTASISVGILFAVSDALVGHLGVKIVQRRWSFAQASSFWGFSPHNVKGVANACQARREPLSQLTSLLMETSLLASFILLPVLLLSGEVSNVLADCYVLTIPQFGRSMLASVSLHCIWLTLLMALLSGATATSLAFLGTPLNSIALAVFCHHKFGPYNWINLSLCWALCMRRACCTKEDRNGAYDNRGRTRCVLLQKIFLIAVTYGAVSQGSYTMIEYLQTGAINLPSFFQPNSKPEVVLKADFLYAFNGSSVAADDYLGSRPDSHIVADFEKIMNNCGDFHEDSGVSDIVECLNYLATRQDDYFMSETTYPITSYLEANPRHSTKVSQSPEDACNGPIRTYHTYWAGHATWRVESFIKAYLYSQNLACSRLWVWLDADIDASALKTMSYHDPLFQRFRPLLDEGYITLKEWKVPIRIPLPRLSKALDPHTLYRPSNPNANGEVAVANSVIQDASGMLWLLLQPLYKHVATPTQVSDLVRFVVLHLHGGVYLDMDVLLLRDLRPLLLPQSTHTDSDLQPAWAEQWVEHPRDPGEYNTAVLSLPANSSLTSYLLRGGLRMGMNFHPRVLGRMMWKDGRNGELGMFHNAVFDPLVTNLRRKGTDKCTVPCHKNFESAFLGTVEEPEFEWSNYEGPLWHAARLNAEEEVATTNRTMENFFRGAFAYHIHNQVRGFYSKIVLAGKRGTLYADYFQWQKFPEKNSWMDVITRTQDGFFSGHRTNAYGEVWQGPALEAYDRSNWGWNSGELRT